MSIQTIPPTGLQTVNLIKINGFVVDTGPGPSTTGTQRFILSTDQTLPLPLGAATSAKQPALGVAGTPSSDVMTVQGSSGGVPLAVAGSVSVLNFPATQAVTGTFFQATQPVSGSVSVGNFPATQAVTGTFFQATQPVSGSVTTTPSGTSQPVTGTVAVNNFPATQAVTGTFFQTTQPVSFPVTTVLQTTFSELGSRMRNSVAAPGYLLQTSVVNPDYLYFMELPAGSSPTTTGLRGIRVKLTTGSIDFGTQYNLGGSCTLTNYRTDSGWQN